MNTNDDPRYSSGTCLSRTQKEERLDTVERMVGEFSDSLYSGLRRLTIGQIKELHKVIADRINSIELPTDN